jgi:hypothetical protein
MNHHSAEERLVKLKAINELAIQGIVNSKNSEERLQFEQIAFQVNYLVNESKEKHAWPKL